MSFILGILAVIFAGVLDGSYAIPIKYMRNIEEDKIWFYFSWWAFLIIPIITLLLIDIHVFNYISKIKILYIIIPFIIGMLWGIGMICVSLAFKMIGIGVNFAVHIGIGTAGGVLFPLVFIHYRKINTTFGYLVLIGVLLFIFGVIFAGRAAEVRDKELKESENKSTHYLLGIILSVIGGVASSIQGFSYMYSIVGIRNQGLINSSNQLFLALLPWIIISIGAFIPFTVFFYIKGRKKNLNFKISKISIFNHISIMIMGLFFFECLFLYTKSSLDFGKLGTIIAWPLFMSFIVLSSNIWGFIFKEWQKADKKACRLIWLSVCVLIMAVIVVSISTNYQ
ncbi:MAG TPA: L-rhamnose/proton symporter RhaT [Victivallales bacterium]|nr:L-rhamnose/proton symporter RhaT [Victivallales bacterium]